MINEELKAKLREDAVELYRRRLLKNDYIHARRDEAVAHGNSHLTIWPSIDERDMTVVMEAVNSIEGYEAKVVFDRGNNCYICEYRWDTE